MNRSQMKALAAALFAAATVGCSDFLTPKKATQDPDNPTVVTTDQLLVAMQQGQSTEQEGAPAFQVCLWMQQCQGVGGRFVQQLSRYRFNEGTNRSDFAAVYTGGGLVDIRDIEARTRAAGDSVYLGVARVWEAFVMGTAADIWGDIPYTEAVNTEFTSPVFDPQDQVYAMVQAQLDSAIAELSTGTGIGPGQADFIYGGDAEKWIEAAHTLKARYYLHLIDLDPATHAPTAADVTNYQLALAEAQQGISTPANDFRTFHTGATFERNIWNQFQLNSGFGDDVVAGKSLVDLMNAQADPRRAEYFTPNSAGQFGGTSVAGSTPPGGAATLRDAPRNAPDFRQPLITRDETLLIQAEALVQTGGNGSAPFNEYLGLHGLPPRPATLQNIMTEKYIALFQNIEVWSDWRRTCYPILTPFENDTYGGYIPERFYYGEFERNTNPNTPSIESQLTNGGVREEDAGTRGVGRFANPNNPFPCP